MYYSFIHGVASRIHSLPDGTAKNTALDALVGFDRMAVGARRMMLHHNEPAEITGETVVSWEDLPEEVRRELRGSADGIFISYRRSDTRHAAGRLHDYLCQHFPPQSIFLDVDRMNPGESVGSSIEDALRSSMTLLALIGDEWAAARDPQGNRRITQPNDYVRMEIRSALSLPITVVPILVDHAQMPDHGLLPADIAGLAEKNAMFLRHETFGSDCSRIVSWIQSTPQRHR